MYLSTLFENNICLITDIDYYLLNKDWFLEKIKQTIENGKFTTIGNNGYYNTTESGKWPMYYNISPSNIFKKIINPDNLDYTSWLNLYKNIKDQIDGKESILNKFNKFSDESLLRYIVVRHRDQEFIKKIWIKQDLEDFVRLKSGRRVDRGWWGHSCIPDKMKSGHYVDCFPIRPFNKRTLRHLRPVLDFLQLDVSPDKIFL